MARLGREAVHQARVNTLGKRREVDLAPVASVADGHWVMPVKIDPFQVYPDEIQDYLMSLAMFTVRTPGASVEANQCQFFKQEKAFASTVGSYCTQRLYRTSGNFIFQLTKDSQRVQGVLESLSPAGVGWELYRDQPLREQIRQLLADFEEDLKLPIKPVDVGRYDTVFNARSVANLLDGTLGRATELDRALGYEANAGGTSYLDTPLQMLGSYQAGAPALTVIANRAEPGGCATVMWDDEGVPPEDFTLVKDGMLTDFQTTRESAGWLKDYYAKSGRSFRSHGCANADAAINAPLLHSPNLVLAPGKEALDFDGLVAGLANGIAIKGAGLDMDFQHLNGMGRGSTYEVKRGKRVARIAGAGVLFRAPELWKALQAVGGAASARRYGGTDQKGEPAQVTYHSVTAVPATFKQLTLIDPQRKA
jgi:TldD protein